MANLGLVTAQILCLPGRQNIPEKETPPAVGSVEGRIPAWKGGIRFHLDPGLGKNNLFRASPKLFLRLQTLPVDSAWSFREFHPANQRHAGDKAFVRIIRNGRWRLPLR